MGQILLDYLYRPFRDPEDLINKHSLGQGGSCGILGKRDGQEVIVWIFDHGLVIGDKPGTTQGLRKNVVFWDQVSTSYYSIARDDRHEREFGSVTSKWTWSLTLRLQSGQSVKLEKAVSSGRLLARDIVGTWQEMKRILLSQKMAMYTNTIQEIDQIDHCYQLFSEVLCKRYLQRLQEAGSVIQVDNILVKHTGLIFKRMAEIPWDRVSKFDVDFIPIRRNKLMQYLNPLPDTVKKRLYLVLRINNSDKDHFYYLPAENLPNWGALVTLVHEFKNLLASKNDSKAHI